MVIFIPILFLLAYLYPYLPGHDRPWCAIKIGTGIDCPGCGMVRSISSLLHGNIRDSFHFHPLGFVVVAFLAYLWFAKVFDRPTGGKWMRYGALAFLFLLITQWVVRFMI